MANSLEVVGIPTITHSDHVRSQLMQKKIENINSCHIEAVTGADGGRAKISTFSSSTSSHGSRNVRPFQDPCIRWSQRRPHNPLIPLLGTNRIIKIKIQHRPPNSGGPPLLPLSAPTTIARCYPSSTLTTSDSVDRAWNTVYAANRQSPPPRPSYKR